MDNDAYGHVNNVVYYSWFDTVVNEYLVRTGVLDIQTSEVIGLVVETHCNYFSPLAFPQTVTSALRVAQLGTSSVRYEIGLFADGAEAASAQGHFVHVYVDRASDVLYRSASRCAQSWNKFARSSCSATLFAAFSS
jgi:acyl-CoA thioester hydrolase